MAREATEDHVPLVVEQVPKTGGDPNLEQTSSYLRWNANVESMMEFPEPGEDFTQLPSCGTPNFDRGLN